MGKWLKPQNGAKYNVYGGKQMGKCNKPYDCFNCKNAQYYETFYEHEKIISCNEKTMEIKKSYYGGNINKMMEILNEQQNNICRWYKMGKPNTNVIITYDD